MLRLSAAPLAFVWFALVGCESGPSPSSATSLDLSEAVAAFTLSPQAADVSRGHDASVIGVVRGDGSVQVASMRPMDASNIWWSEDVGLFVSDDSRDYILGPEGAAISSKKADFQNGVLQVPGSSTVVAVYNDGFADDGGYVDDLVITQDGRSKRTKLPGDYTVLSACEGLGVFGFGTVFGEDQPQWEPGKVHARRVDQDGTESWIDLGTEARLIGQRAACENGIVNALVAVPEVKGESVRDRLLILSWNAKSGKHQLKPLTLEGSRVTTANVSKSAQDGALETLLADGGSIGPDGWYEWYSDTGKLYATDPDSGETTERFDSGWVTEESDVSAIQFTRDAVAILTHDTDGDTLELVRIDRRTGEELELIEIPNFVDGEIDGLVADSSSLVLRGFALNPSD